MPTPPAGTEGEMSAGTLGANAMHEGNTRVHNSTQVENDFCLHCGGWTGGYRCKRRACPNYGRLYVGDWTQVMYRNLEEYQGDVLMVTVTAPGSTILPWQCAVDSWTPTLPVTAGPGADVQRHKCSGDNGCRVEPKAAAKWNRSARFQWSKMHRATAQYLRRRGHPVSLVTQGWEFQKRGVLHKHVVLGCKTPSERHAARLYADRLKAVAPSYGFGFVDNRAKPIASFGAAAYLTGYLLMKGKGGSLKLGDTVTHPDVPPSILYVARSLTCKTGVTMRYLRDKRYLWAIGKGRCRPPSVIWCERRTDGRLQHLRTGEILSASPTRGP